MGQITLKDIEDRYAGLMRVKNSPVSFGEYVRRESSLSDIDAAATKQKSSALADASIAASDYGSTAEALASRGLTSSGYAAYAKDRTAAELKSRLADIDERHKAATASAKQSYLDYVRRYEEKQNSLRKSVTNSLTSDRVVDAEEIYRYAAEQGLGAEAARGLYGDVYRSVSRAIKSEILYKVYMNEITPEIAATYASSMGLSSEDVKDIERKAMNYMQEFAGYSAEYLAYLESIADKTTVTYE